MIIYIIILKIIEKKIIFSTPSPTLFTLAHDRGIISEIEIKVTHCSCMTKHTDSCSHSGIYPPINRVRSFPILVLSAELKVEDFFFYSCSLQISLFYLNGL